jgi:hypothetical protein
MQHVYPIFGRQSYIWPGDASVRVVNIGLGTKPEAIELRAEDRTLTTPTYLDPYLRPATTATRATTNIQRTAPAWLPALKQGKAYEDFKHYTKLDDDLVLIQRDHPEMLVNKIGASNLLSGKENLSIWFGNRTPKSVAYTPIAKRRQAVLDSRGASHRKGPEWIPSSLVTGDYMVVPVTYSSKYLVTPVTVVSGQNYFDVAVYYAPLNWFHVGVIMSSKVRSYLNEVNGKKGKGGDPRCSNQTLFGMDAPKNDTPSRRDAIAAQAKVCIDLRPGPASECMKVTNMPAELAQAHAELDRLVEEWWG